MRLLKPAYDSLSDEQLVHRMQLGDKRAFDQLYGRYAQALFYFFMRALWKDKEKAQDFVHDFFAKLIQQPQLFDINRSFKTWMYAVANNMCKNEYRKQGTRKEMYAAGGDAPLAVPDPAMNVLKVTQDAQFNEAFQSALKNMDDKHREVFTLRHIEGLSLKEIAEILQINGGTVKSRLFYATKHLATVLKEFERVLID
jgi:RNA polymerase sigma-70 factor (ECF subfamily)